MTIYEMTKPQLEEYRECVANALNHYEQNQETLLVELIKNKIRIIDDRIRYLHDKPIWDLV
jgi:hypothetical protein